MNVFRLVFCGLMVAGFIEVNGMNRSMPGAPKKPSKTAMQAQQFRESTQTLDAFLLAMESHDYSAFVGAYQEVINGTAYLSDEHMAEVLRLLANRQQAGR